MNIAIENEPFKMYVLLKREIFHCDVSLPEATFLLGYGLCSRAMLVSGRVHVCSDSSDTQFFLVCMTSHASKLN